MRIILVFFCLCSMLIAQTDNTEYFEDIFRLERNTYGNTESTNKAIDTLAESHPMANLVNNNSLIYNYLFEHLVDIPSATSKAFSQNPKDLATYLAKDTTFINLFSSIGTGTVKSNQYSKLDIIKVAVRFFYPHFIMNGKIKGHICIGFNGMNDYDNRDYISEGFIFQSIFWNLDYKDDKIYNEFHHALDLADSFSLSEDEETKFNRAQGFVWAIMKDSEVLWEIIEKEYKLRKDILPFEITGI